MNEGYVNGHGRERLPATSARPEALLVDVAAERAVIAACLLDPKAVTRIRQIVVRSDFYAEQLGTIFGAILHVHADGERVDVETVRAWLEDRGKLALIGGVSTLLELTDTVPDGEWNAQRVRLLARKRAVETAAKRLVTELADPDSAPRALSRLRAACDQLENGDLAATSGMSPAEVVSRWRTEGPLIRVPTGIAELDAACRGGFPIPWRVMLVGAPSAGKTCLSVTIASRLARGLASQGLCVGILAVDEDPDDLTVRLAQIEGFKIAAVEARGPHTLAEVEAALSSTRIRLFDGTSTVEQAAADVAQWARDERRPGAFFIDSTQTVLSERARSATSPREVVDANARAIRSAAAEHGLLVVATCEANRASYRDADAAQSTNDMAAGAESRAIEFVAQTQLVLRTPKGHPDVIHVRIAKNRRAQVGEFWLRLDRESHSLSPCDNPAGDSTGKDDASKAESVRHRIEQDALTLAKVVVGSPGVGERGLRSAMQLAGVSWGRDRLDAAKACLMRGVSGSRLVNRGSPRECHWHVEAVHGSEQP